VNAVYLKGGNVTTFKRSWLIIGPLALLLWALLACGGTGDFADFDTRTESYTCPAGTRPGVYEPHGAPICWRP
jgi:hypothetical protein